MAHDRLKALDCFKDLHDRIVAKVPLWDCVRWLQNEKGELADLKADSVYRALTRYKGDIPPGEMSLVDKHVTQERLEDIRADLDELDALNRLWHLQLARIKRFETLEAQLQGVNLNFAKDIDEARKILADSAALKFKLGIYKEQQQSVTVNHNILTHKALDALTPDERRRAGVLAQITLRHLTLAPGDTVPDELPVEIVQVAPPPYPTLQTPAEDYFELDTDDYAQNPS